MITSTLDDLQLRAAKWVTGRDTGRSSLTIWAVMFGAVVRDGREWTRYGVPLDPSDFGRCYRLLALIPEWRERLPEVAQTFPEWTALVGAWPELEAMYETAMAKPRNVHGINDESRRMYDRMRELENRTSSTPKSEGSV